MTTRGTLAQTQLSFYTTGTENSKLTQSNSPTLEFDQNDGINLMTMTASDSTDGKITLTGPGNLSILGLPLAVNQSSDATSATSKSYVDSLAISGVSWKNTCVLATDGNETGTTYVYDGTAVISVTGDTKIDGIEPANLNRILFKDTNLITGGTAADSTGIYVVSAYSIGVSMTLTRTTDATNGDSANGAAVFIYDGDAVAPLNNDTSWVVTNDAAVNWGGAVVWTQMTAAPVLGNLTEDQMFVGDTGGDAKDGGANLTYDYSSRSTAPVFGVGVDTSVANASATFNLGTGSTGANVPATVNMGKGAGAVTLASGITGAVSLFDATTSGTITAFGAATGNVSIANATGMTLNVGGAATAVNLGASASATNVSATGTGTVTVGNTSSATVDVIGIDMAVGSTATTTLDLLATGISGDINMTAGDATSSGTVSISTTTATTATVSGGEIDLTAGDGNTTGSGGAIDINAGAGGAIDTSVGGTVTINSGGSAASNGDGGDITITAAAATGSGTDGNLNIVTSGNTVIWPVDQAVTGDVLKVTSGGVSATLEWAPDTGNALVEDNIFIGNGSGVATDSGANFTIDQSAIATTPILNIAGTGALVGAVSGTINLGTVGAADVTSTINMGKGVGAVTIDAQTTSPVNLFNTVTSGAVTAFGTATGTVSVANATAMTLNVGGAATAVNLGASASATNVSATGTGTVTVGNTSSATVDVIGIDMAVGSTTTTGLDLLATGASGTIVMTAGDVTGSGTVSISTTTATTATVSGGEIDLTAGDGATTGSGGAIDINAGSGGATDASVGGTVTINSGGSAATNGDGGDITITATAATGTGNDGLVQVINGAAVLFQFPTVQGSLNDILTTTAAGITSWTTPSGTSMLALPEDQLYIGNGGVAAIGGTSFTVDRTLLTSDPTLNISGTGNTETNTLSTINLGTVGGATVTASMNIGLGAVGSAINFDSTGTNLITSDGALTVSSGSGTITVDGTSSQIDVGPATTGVINVGSSSAGAVTIASGSTVTVNSGLNVDLNAGGDGGNVTIDAAVGTSGAGGLISVQSGTGFDGSVIAAGGAITIDAGDGGSNDTATGGAAGDISITGGIGGEATTATQIGGTGSSIDITAGVGGAGSGATSTGGAGGSITLQAAIGGTGTSTAGAVGNMILKTAADSPSGGSETTNIISFQNATGNLGTNPRMEADGQFYATAFNAVSDVNFKKNITPLSDPLETLKKIEGYSYDWKSSQLNDKRQIGVIAQQLEDVGLGNLVSGTSSKAVNYMGLIPILIEAVKELSAKVDYQDSRRF
jgi:hypothetical protein